MQAISVREHNTVSIGLILGLSSWALVFVTLVWGYLVFRLRTGAWLNEAVTPQVVALATGNTLVLALSSYIYPTTKPIQWQTRLTVSLLLGLLFMAGQFLLWQTMLGQGLHWQKSTAGSFFFLLTGFHVAHILLALPFMLVLVCNQQRLFGSSFERGVRYFWHFLFAVWCILFALIFIIQ